MTESKRGKKRSRTAENRHAIRRCVGISSMGRILDPLWERWLRVLDGLGLKAWGSSPDLQRLPPPKFELKPPSENSQGIVSNINVGFLRTRGIVLMKFEYITSSIRNDVTR